MAKQKGVKCVINLDAHRAARLHYLWFGVGIARKGWARERRCRELPAAKQDPECAANETV
jgi:histidinol phosphatase-like PHP family hydrolase